MKLLTHNFLSSAFLKNVKIGYPLILKVTSAEIIESEYDSEFTKRMLAKIEFPALVEAAKSVAIVKPLNIPAEKPADWEDNETFLEQVYQLLNCVDVTVGELVCPETGRVFSIRDGIPNMLANEDEVD